MLQIRLSGLKQTEDSRSRLKLEISTPTRRAQTTRDTRSVDLRRNAFIQRKETCSMQQLKGTKQR